MTGRAGEGEGRNAPGDGPGGTEPSAGSAGPDPTLPDVLREYVDLVNRGAYWESHEALEDAWRASGSEFYHGLILYASAFVHAVRGTPHGIRAQLGKAEAALGDFPDAYLGVDVRGILDHARRCRRLVEAREGEPDADWEEVVPLPRLELRADRVRGDEPELETG